MTILETHENLTLKQAAQFLNISCQMLYRLTYQRQLPFIRIGRKIIFRRSDLEAFLCGHTVPAKPA